MESDPVQTFSFPKLTASRHDGGYMGQATHPFFIVGDVGIEPTTSSLSETRSTTKPIALSNIREVFGLYPPLAELNYVPKS